MSSYVELQRIQDADGAVRIALPDDVTREIACRLDGAWVLALHNALTSHRPRGGERFAEALDAVSMPAAVVFEMAARSEGDPPVHVVRWTDELVPLTDVAPARQLRPRRPQAI